MSEGRKTARLTLVLTTGCNMNCSYCYQRVSEPRSMDWPTARAGVDLALSMAGRKVELTFYGGEPLLEFDLLKRVVDHVEASRGERRVRYWVVTNGTLITEEVAQYLAEREFKVLMSFDGVPGAQAFRGPDTFERLDGVLDLLRENHHDYSRRAVEIGITVPPDAVQFMADSVDYFLQKGVKEIDLNPVMTPRPGWSDDRVRELEEQFERILASSLAHLERTREVPLKLYSGHGKLTGPPPSTRAMCEIVDSNSWAVDVDGTVSGCTLFVPSIQAYDSPLLQACRPTMVLGEVTDAGIQERLASFSGRASALPLISKKERKYSSYRRCADCRFFSACVTCPVANGFIEGNTDPDRVPDYYCAFNYSALASRDGFPVQPTVLEAIRGDRYRELREKWRRWGDGARREA